MIAALTYGNLVLIYILLRLFATPKGSSAYDHIKMELSFINTVVWVSFLICYCCRSVYIHEYLGHVELYCMNVCMGYRHSVLTLMIN